MVLGDHLLLLGAGPVWHFPTRGKASGFFLKLAGPLNHKAGNELIHSSVQDAVFHPMVDFKIMLLRVQKVQKGFWGVGGVKCHNGINLHVG